MLYRPRQRRHSALCDPVISIQFVLISSTAFDNATYAQAGSSNDEEHHPLVTMGRTEATASVEEYTYSVVVKSKKQIPTPQIDVETSQGSNVEARSGNDNGSGKLTTDNDGGHDAATFCSNVSEVKVMQFTNKNTSYSQNISVYSLIFLCLPTRISDKGTNP